MTNYELSTRVPFILHVCELQYRRQVCSEFSIENAERMENCP